MLIRHHKQLRHWRRIHAETDAYGGMTDVVVYIAVLALSMLALVMGWI